MITEQERFDIIRITTDLSTFINQDEFTALVSIWKLIQMRLMNELEEKQVYQNDGSGD